MRELRSSIRRILRKFILQGCTKHNGCFLSLTGLHNGFRSLIDQSLLTYINGLTTKALLVLCYPTMIVPRPLLRSICFLIIRFIPSQRMIHVSLIRIHRSSTMILVQIRTSVMYLIYRALLPLRSHNVISIRSIAILMSRRRQSKVMCENCIGRNVIIFRS